MTEFEASEAQANVACFSTRVASLSFTYPLLNNNSLEVFFLDSCVSELNSLIWFRGQNTCRVPGVILLEDVLA